ncbi:hypothetical protein ACRAWG_29990 [Methylobacterium sp. P31]
MRRRIGLALAVVVVAGAALVAGPWSRGYRLSDLLTGRTSMLPDGTRAAAGAATLSGNATLGTDQRAVTLRIACDPAGPGLSAALTVPRFAELAPGFDFAGLEGSDKTAPLTGILVSNAGSVRSVRMPGHGTASTDPEASFVMTVSGARRGEDPLRGIALAMTQPGTKIIWTQASPRANDAPLTATFTVSEADAAALRSALNGCLAAPF